jgi:MYXO-CTERM domain-containing protein
VRRLALAGATLAVGLAASTPLRALCPSYTPAETTATNKCGVDPAPGTNPTVDAWKDIFGTVVGGKAAWGSGGPDIGTLGEGCGKPTATHQVAAHFPCHVLMAIAMQESSWKQFCVPDSPSASVGAPERTIVSFDCGYGVGQVTSGMHVGETPAFDRARVAGDPTYNLATGTLILRDKWAATNCVGDNQPDVVEDWYVALWAYNGLSYTNNPNNPNLTAGRGPYDPKAGGSYTYQERVLGWMEHPPDAAHWPVLAPAYPNRGDIGAGTPPDLPEPSCASPTSCAQTRDTHTSTFCATASAPDAGPADADADAEAPIEDAGEDAGPPPEAPPSGCSCHATSGGADASWALVIIVAALLRRRR